MPVLDDRPRPDDGRGNRDLPLGDASRHAGHVQGDLMHVAPAHRPAELRANAGRGVDPQARVEKAAGGLRETQRAEGRGDGGNHGKAARVRLNPERGTWNPEPSFYLTGAK